jgi:hypothetical protein
MTSPQVVRVILLPSNTTNPLLRNTIPTTPLLSNHTILTKLLLLNNTKVDTIRIRTRTKVTANNRTTVVPLLNSTVGTSTITVRKDSISRVRPRDSGIIRVDTSSSNSTIINLLRIMVVGDLLVDIGVRGDFDELIYD